MGSKNFIHSAKDLLLKSSSVGRTMLEKSFLEKERRDLFGRLGELTYALIKSKNLELPVLNELVNELDLVNEKISSTEFVFTDRNLSN